MIKEIIIPAIEKEVNTGKTFSELRQIYNSMILAAWYKNNLRQTLLGQIYVDKNKTRGVDVKDKAIKQKIYEQYLAAFKKGVYNYIKEDYDPTTKKLIPRKYFSGGYAAKDLSWKVSEALSSSPLEHLSARMQQLILERFERNKRVQVLLAEDENESRLVPAFWSRWQRETRERESVTAFLEEIETGRAPINFQTPSRRNLGKIKRLVDRLLQSRQILGDSIFREILSRYDRELSLSETSMPRNASETQVRRLRTLIEGIYFSVSPQAAVNNSSLPIHISYESGLAKNLGDIVAFKIAEPQARHEIEEALAPFYWEEDTVFPGDDIKVMVVDRIHSDRSVRGEFSPERGVVLVESGIRVDDMKKLLVEARLHQIKQQLARDFTEKETGELSKVLSELKGKDLMPFLIYYNTVESKDFEPTLALLERMRAGEDFDNDSLVVLIEQQRADLKKVQDKVGVFKIVKAVFEFLRRHPAVVMIPMVVLLSAGAVAGAVPEEAGMADGGGSALADGGAGGLIMGDGGSGGFFDGKISEEFQQPPSTDGPDTTPSSDEGTHETQSEKLQDIHTDLLTKAVYFSGELTGHVLTMQTDDGTRRVLYFSALNDDLEQALPTFVDESVPKSLDPKLQEKRAYEATDVEARLFGFSTLEEARTFARNLAAQTPNATIHPESVETKPEITEPDSGLDIPVEPALQTEEPTTLQEGSTAKGELSEPPEAERTQSKPAEPTEPQEELTAESQPERAAAPSPEPVVQVEGPTTFQAGSTAEIQSEPAEAEPIASQDGPTAEGETVELKSQGEISLGKAMNTDSERAGNDGYGSGYTSIGYGYGYGGSWWKMSEAKYMADLAKYLSSLSQAELADQPDGLLTQKGVRNLVFFYPFTITTGGVATFQRAVIEGLLKTNKDVTIHVVYLNFEEAESELEYVHELNNNRVVFHGVPTENQNNVQRRHLMKKALKNIQDNQSIDLIVNNGSEYIELALGLIDFAEDHDIPTYTYYHGGNVTRGLVDVMSRSSVAAANSRAYSRIFQQHGTDVEVIYPVADISYFNPDELSEEDYSEIQRLKTQYELEGKTVVVHVARVDPQKGQQDTIEAAKIMKERLRQQGKKDDIAVVIIGPPHAGEGERLRAIAGDSVIFVGNQTREEIRRWISIADIGVYPSRWEEPFGLVSTEFQAMGKPVIVSRVGGLPETLIDGETGLVVEKANPQQLADALTYLIENPQKRIAMGRRASEYIRNQYEFSKTIRKYEESYLSAIEKHKRKKPEKKPQVVMDASIPDVLFDPMYDMGYGDGEINYDQSEGGYQGSQETEVAVDRPISFDEIEGMTDEQLFEKLGELEFEQIHYSTSFRILISKDHEFIVRIPLLEDETRRQLIDRNKDNPRMTAEELKNWMWGAERAKDQYLEIHDENLRSSRGVFPVRQIVQSKPLKIKVKLGGKVKTLKSPKVFVEKKASWVLLEQLEQLRANARHNEVRSLLKQMLDKTVSEQWEYGIIDQDASFLFNWGRYDDGDIRLFDLGAAGRGEAKNFKDFFNPDEIKVRFGLMDESKPFSLVNIVGRDIAEWFERKIEETFTYDNFVRHWERKTRSSREEDLTHLPLSNLGSSPVATTPPDDVGGIDFDSALLNLQIKRDGRGVPLPLPQQTIQNINIEGFFPVIINVTPINLPLILGFDTKSFNDLMFLASNSPLSNKRYPVSTRVYARSGLRQNEVNGGDIPLPESADECVESSTAFQKPLNKETRYNTAVFSGRIGIQGFMKHGSSFEALRRRNNISKIARLPYKF